MKYKHQKLSVAITATVTVIIWLIIGTLFLGATSIRFADEHSNASNSNVLLIDTLAKFRDLRDAGSLLLALKYGSEALKNDTLFENNNYSKQESLFWEVSDAYMEYIDKIDNRIQSKECAGKAAQNWKLYIEWYSSIAEGQLEKLKPSHARIKMAVAHYGNSLIRKGDLDALYSEYFNIASNKIEHFGVDAIAIWKNGLYGCPDGNVKKQHTAKTRRESIQGGCCEQWGNYAQVLSEWIDVERLQAASIAIFKREIQQIQKEIEQLGEKM